MSAIPPTPTGGAGSSRSSTTPRPVSTTCNTPPATPRATPNSGSEGYHESCQENLHTALEGFGIALQFTPQPWNLFTNFFINPDGTFTIKAPQSRPGDCIVLRAEMDATIVVSACPQDQNLTCGGRPTDIRVEVGR